MTDDRAQRIITAATNQAASMEAWLKREIHTSYATRQEGIAAAFEMALTHLHRIQRTLQGAAK